MSNLLAAAAATAAVITLNSALGPGRANLIAAGVVFLFAWTVTTAALRALAPSPARARSGADRPRGGAA